MRGRSMDLFSLKSKTGPHHRLVAGNRLRARPGPRPGGRKRSSSTAATRRSWPPRGGALRSAPHFRPRAYPFDITDETQVAEAVKAIEKRGRPYRRPRQQRGDQTCAHPIEEFPSDEWHAVMNTNLHGLFYVSKAVGKRMIRRKARQDHPHRVAAQRGRAPHHRPLRGPARAR